MAYLEKNISINQIQRTDHINVFPAYYGDLHIISLCDISLALGTVNRTPKESAEQEIKHVFIVIQLLHDLT